MEPLILDSLKKWKELYVEGHHEDAMDHLLAIMQYSSKMIYKKNIANLDTIRYLLEQGIEGEHPENLQSFILGLAQSTVQQIMYWMIPWRMEDLKHGLSDGEKRVLRCLADYDHIRPTQIMEITGIENRQNMSNYLRKLRAKELVHCWEAGKYRWYELTISGHQMLESIGGFEELASREIRSSAQNVVHLEDARNKKAKKKDRKMPEYFSSDLDSMDVSRKTTHSIRTDQYELIEM